MMKWAKILAATVLGVIVLLAAVTTILVWRIDPNDYKSYLTEQFEARTGRSLSIDSDLRFELYPWLAVEAGAITIGNAAGFQARPFATLERMSARVKLLPLLQRKIEVGTIVLRGLTLNLGRDRDGRGNWADLLAHAEAGSTEAGEPDRSSSFGDVGIAGIEIRNGEINWREGNDELRYALRDIVLDTGSIRAATPVDVDAAMQVQDAVEQRSARVTLKTSIELADAKLTLRNGTLRARVDAASPGSDEREVAASWQQLSLDTTAGTLTTEGLATQTAGIQATWQLAGQQFFAEPRLSGAVAIEKAPLTGAMQLFNYETPPQVDRRTLGDFDASARFDFDLTTGHIAVDSLTARLLDARVTGSAQLDGRRLRGRLEIPRVRPGDPLRRLAAAYLPAAIDVSALQQVGFASELDADLDAGTATLSGIRAEWLGASWSGQIDVVPTAGGRRYRGTLRSSRFAPAEFAAVFAPLLTDKLRVSELGMLAIDARFDYDGVRDVASLDPLSLEVFGLRASGRLALRSLSSSPKMSGEAHVAAFDPRDLFRRFGQPIPATSDAGVLRSAAIDTRFSIDEARGRFEQLVLRLDDSRISGDFTVDDFEHPAYRFALRIDQVDADRYLPPRAQAAADNERKTGDIELSSDALNTLHLAGRVDAGELTLGGMHMQDVGTDLELGNGIAKLDSAKAKLYGGEFAGSLALDATGDEPQLRLSGKATRLALKPLITALAGEADLSGNGDFELDLAGHGKTVTDNVHSAAGRVEFALRNGVIDGFNLGRSLCAAYNLTQKLPAPPKRALETPYRLIRGTADVAGGVASSPDLLARAPFMDVTGRGRLDLADRGLSYDLEAKLTGSIAIPGCASMDALVGESLPLTLRGTLDEPEIRPDFNEILRRRAQDELKKRLQQKLQDRLRDLL